MKEITVQVFDSIDEINKSLLKQNYKMIEYYELNDWYFSRFSMKECMEKSYTELLKNSFIVREILDEKPQVQLCYKIKELDEHENLINEEKIKVILPEKSKPLEIFKKAGLTNWCEVKNKTNVYQKENIIFFLQQIEDLGTFIEYEEDDSMKALTEEEKTQFMINNLKSLGLCLGDNFYAKKVFLKFKKQNNII